MGFYSRFVLPRLIDLAMRAPAMAADCPTGLDMIHPHAPARLSTFSENAFVRPAGLSRGPSPSSLQHDLDDVGDLLVALVLGLDADDPARLEVSERQCLLDEAGLSGLGGTGERDDLRP